MKCCSSNSDDSDTALPGRMTFHTAVVDPTVRPDAPERQSIECRAFLFFPDFEPNTCPVSAEMVEMSKKVTGAAHVHVFHHQLRAAKDNSDGNGFNTSVQPHVMAVHSDSSRHAAEEAFLRIAGNTGDAKSCKGRFGYINAWRNVTTDPTENNHLAECDETSLVAPDDYLASDLFMPGFRLMPSDVVAENVDPVEDDAEVQQSPDIAGGVHVGKDDFDVGAGGQGIMFGYASDKTEVRHACHTLDGTSFGEEMDRRSQEW